MKTPIETIRFAAVALAICSVCSSAALAQVDEDVAFGDDYGSGDFGRVRQVDEGVRVVRAHWDNQQGVQDDAGINAPVFPGDAIHTDRGQRTEVELAGGTVVWIDRQTELTFLALPDPYATVSDHGVLQLTAGTVRLESSLRDDEELRIDTPAASVYPIGDADLRIEVVDGGRTRVESRRGVVEVVANGGSVLLRAGTRTRVDPGGFPHEAQPFNTLSGDGFDAYVEERQRAFQYREGYAGGPEVYRELPSEVRPYYRELSAHGSWIYTDEYGYLWQPTNLASDWRPYREGYWGYGPSGYFWISNEPWGWAPYHYGRWSYLSGYGWCWSPGRVFAGAWVSWSWGSLYVGWSPLDYWNYPAYHSTWYHGYYDPHCWTFVSYHHLHHHGYHHYSVPWDHVSHHVHRSAVVTRPPRVPPDQLASSRTARSRALDEVRGDPRRRLAESSKARPTGRTFRSSEAQTSRNDESARPRRDVPSAPVGRGRTVAAEQRPRDDRTPVRRGGSARDVDRGRERLPVVAQPRNRRESSDTGPGRVAAPSGERRPTSRLKEEAGRDGTTKQGVSGRVRDMYRKMAQPRQTRERGESTKPSRTKTSERARSAAPRSKSRSSSPGASRAPAKPSRPQAKPPRKSGSSSSGASPGRKKKGRDSASVLTAPSSQRRVASSPQPRRKSVEPLATTRTRSKPTVARSGSRAAPSKSRAGMRPSARSSGPRSKPSKAPSRSASRSGSKGGRRR